MAVTPDASMTGRRLAKPVDSVTMRLLVLSVLLTQAALVIRLVAKHRVRTAAVRALGSRAAGKPAWTQRDSAARLTDETLLAASPLAAAGQGAHERLHQRRLQSLCS
jgi:hypothetical protein